MQDRMSDALRAPVPPASAFAGMAGDPYAAGARGLISRGPAPSPGAPGVGLGAMAAGPPSGMTNMAPPQIAMPSPDAQVANQRQAAMGGIPGAPLGDMARLQAMNQARAAPVPGQGWDMAKAVGLGGMAGGLGGSPIGAGVGAGAGALMEMLRQRKRQQPLKQATGGLVKTEPKRMAMGGVAKLRKGYPNCKGMGKAVKGGGYKGSK